MAALKMNVLWRKPVGLFRRLFTWFNQLVKVISSSRFQRSYSQSGEDLIVDFVLHLMRIDSPSYLDVGCHHPWYFNNTYRFYRNGSRGVCIEPDPDQFQIIKKHRSKDVCLNVGVGIDKKKTADFFVFNEKTLNTFSEKDAKRYDKMPTKSIQKVIQIPLMDINDIIANHLSKDPDFVSIDVEGWDLEIVRKLNFKKYRPAVFCIETITYTENKTEKKIREIITFMKSRGYFVYGDTYINTIFVDSKRWQER